MRVSRALRWLRRLGWRILGVRGQEERPTMQYHEERGLVDPQAILSDATEREAQARQALAELSRAYHAGNQPLTVARARALVMRRMFPTEEELGGRWQRKPS